MIRITKDNLQTITFRLRQHLSRHGLMEHYTDWGRYPKSLNRMGIKNGTFNKSVEKSRTGFILAATAKVVAEPRYGIFIHVSTDTSICIPIGQKIHITPHIIKISGVNDSLKQPFTTYISPSSQFEKAENEHYWENVRSRVYWDSVKEETNR